MSNHPTQFAPGGPDGPDDLGAALDALVEQLLTGSNESPGCPSVVHVHTTEVDTEVDPPGSALKQTEEVITVDSQRAAETAANMPAPEVVRTPSAIPHDAIEVTGLATHVVESVGPAMEEQARQAREARAAISKIQDGNEAARHAIDSYRQAGGLILGAAKQRFYKAALAYHRFALGYSIAGSALAAAASIDPLGFAINIAANAFVYGVAHAHKK